MVLLLKLQIRSFRNCKMMSATVDNGLSSGFSVGLRNHEEMIVLHLLFADDLIYCEPNCEQIVTCWG